MSSNRRYIKKQIGNDEVVFKANETRYRQLTYELTQESVEKEQKKVITEIKPNGVVILYGIFYVRKVNRNKEWIPQFNKEIKKSIEDRCAVAASDASVKDGKMGRCQIIANIKKKELISNELYHKKMGT